MHPLKLDHFLKALLFGYMAFINACKGQNPIPAASSPVTMTNTVVADSVAEIDGEIRSIFQDSQHNLWFASNGEGVFKYDGKTMVQFTEKHGLYSNFVWNIQEDKEGNIWFKTNVRPTDTDGICYFNGTEFKKIQADPVMPNDTTLNGELLFDYHYAEKSLKKIQLPHTSPIKNEANIRQHYDIYCTCIDRNGNLWFGTCNAGICQYNGKTFTWFDNMELGAAIRSIFEDKNGTIWAGNNGDGLFRFDGKNFINFSKEKNLHNPDFEKYPIGKPGLLSRVWIITDDNQGNLWLGTIDNGVWKYDGKTITNYTTKDGLGIDSIWTIYKDKTGRLWFGTAGDGVYLFNGKKFEKFKPGR